MPFSIRIENRELSYLPEQQALTCQGDGVNLLIPLQSFLRHSCARPWQLQETEKLQTTPVMQDAAFLLQLHTSQYALDLHFSSRDGVFFLQATWNILQPLNDAVLGLVLSLPAASRLTIPMSLYNDNPSTPPERLAPHFPPVAGASLVLEESRLPIPAVNAEWDGVFFTWLLLPGGQWSLGAERPASKHCELTLCSGALAFNGQHDKVYSYKGEVRDCTAGYQNYAPGDTLQKSFAWNWGTCTEPGWGFRDLAQSGFTLLQPQATPVLDRQEMIERKMAALRERWAGDGYLTCMPDNIYRRPPYFLYGWTGQSLRLAYCDLRYAKLSGRRDGIDRAFRCLDFFLNSDNEPLPGLRYNYYYLEEDKWCVSEGTGFSSRALGETYADLARILLYCRKSGLDYPSGYQDALRRGVDFMLAHCLPAGVPPKYWDLSGQAAHHQATSAGTSYLQAIWGLFQLTGEHKYRLAAEDFLERFWNLGGSSFDRPFACSTLDSGCEDKEAGIPFFVAAAEAWRLTGDEHWRTYAEVTADWLLTWVYFWDVPLRPDSICARHGFKTTGWPTVSVENQHLDVFFPAWEFYRFGRDCGSERIRKMGETVFQAWSHGISSGAGDWMFPTPGRQGEQFFQTNWVYTLRQEKYPEPYRRYFRKYGFNQNNAYEMNSLGGYNPWDTSWIIALVLDAALDWEIDARDNQQPQTEQMPHPGRNPVTESRRF